MKKLIAAVTGSARGIGLGIAKKLLSEGYSVLLSDILPTEEKDEIIKPLIEQGFSDCDYIKCDIAKAEDRDNFFEYIIGKYGVLDVLVNNAGVAAKMFEALYNANINIQMISTSEIKISVLIDQKDADRAVEAVHDIFFN